MNDLLLYLLGVLSGIFISVCIFLYGTVYFKKKYSNVNSIDYSYVKRKPSHNSQTNTLLLKSWVKCSFEKIWIESTDDVIPSSIARIFQSSSGITSELLSRLPNNFYFAQLYNSNDVMRLKFYSNHLLTELKYEFKVENFEVNLIPTDMLDFEFYSKNFPIQLKSNDHTINVFLPTSVDKEDWFLTLKGWNYNINTRLSSSYSFFSIPQTLSDDIKEESCVWFNALMERMFKSLHLREFLLNRLKLMLSQKLKRVQSSRSKEPNFMLTELELTGLPVGSGFHMIHNDSCNGLVFDFDISFGYNKSSVDDDNLKRTEKYLMGTVEQMVAFDGILAQVNVPVALSVKLGELFGRAQLRFKPQPSNRIWFGFHPPGPSFELDVIPQVSSFGIRLSVFSDAIKYQIDSLFQENCIIPNMSDFAFSRELADKIQFPTNDRKDVPTDSNQSIESLAMMGDGVENSLLVSSIFGYGEYIGLKKQE